MMNDELKKPSKVTSSSFAVAFSFLSALLFSSAFSVQRSALASPPAQATTETLRAEIFGGDEVAADFWVQFHASRRLERWNDAARAAQNILTSPSTVLVRSSRDPSLYWPAHRMVADLLAQQPPLAAAYQAAFESQARALLTEFERDGRMQTLERVRAEFPFVSLRGRALRLLADGYLDRCDFVRGAAAFAQLQASEKPADSKEAAIWACKEASSLLASAQFDRAAERVAAIRQTFANVTIVGPGPRLKVGEFCDRLEKELAAKRRPPDTTFSAERLRSAQGWSFDFHARSFDPVFRSSHPDRSPSYEPACLNGIVYSTNGNELRAVEIAGGREQWRWEPDRPDRYNVQGDQPWLDPLPPTSLRPAVSDRFVLFLRPMELAEAVLSVCGLDRASGRLIWQRVAWSDEPEAIETAPVVFGDCAFVVVSTLRRVRSERATVVRRAAVCFRIANGELLWRTLLPSSRVAGDEAAPGSVGVPSVGATGLFVLEDRGTLYSLEPATGEIRWARLLEKPAAEPSPIHPGSGWCVAAGDRVCAARAGSPQVECLDARSGERVWVQEAGAPVGWLAIHGKQVFVADRELRALEMANGAVAWHGEAAESPIGPGCFVGELALIPTANALHVYDLKNGRLADRIVWPDKRPLTHLIASAGDLVGMAGDTVCKFGKPGQIVEAPKPQRTDPKQPSVASPTAGGAVQSAQQMAARLFPHIAINPNRETAPSIARIGRPLAESPTEWVVYDSSAHQLNCFSANEPTRPRWQAAFQGDIRSIEFDRDYVYLWCPDRVEVRGLREDGRQLFSKAAKTDRKPVFEEGRILLTYERGEGSSKQTRIAGFDRRTRREFDVPIGSLGLQKLAAYVWDGDRVILLAGDNKPGYACYPARIEGDRLKLEDIQGRPQRIYNRVDAADVPWVAFERTAVFAAPLGDAVYAWDLAAARQAWRSPTTERGGRKGDQGAQSLALLGRSGHYLLWQRLPAQPADDRLIGITELQSGTRVGAVEGRQAIVFQGRVYSLSGRVLRLHEFRTGKVIREIVYQQRGMQPVWIQPFGDRLVVALADEQGTIRQAMFQDPQLGEAGPRGADGRAARFTEVFLNRDPIIIDGWLDDWERVQMGWQQITDWRPVLDRSGRPVAEPRAPNDLTARWRACIGEDALYLAVKVHDERAVSARWSDCPWTGDSLEIALAGESPQRNLPTFTLALDGPGQCWAAGPRLPAEQARVRYDPIEKELVYEMAFPWTWLYKASILSAQTLPERTSLAFALSVNDDDGRGLIGSLEWGEGLSESWNPSAWKALRFSVAGRRP